VTAQDDTRTRLAAIVGAPDFVLPWLDRFYDEDDVELALAVGDGARTVSELAAALAVAEDDLRPRLARAHRRSVVEVTGERAGPASFADRSGLWAQFEGWKDVPGAVREQLVEWWLADYTESVRPALTKLRDGHPDPGRDADYAYLLLAEAEELVRSQERVYLWPCDCRTLKGGCDQSIYNCIRFANDRDLGWEISKERAIAILHEADAAGLTHTDYVGLGGESDPHAICNCCTDCCQPHLAAERLGVGDIWPRRRHVARLLPDECTLCGTCTERCPFGALEIASGPMGGEALVLTASECRGCGLCATGCPEGAIAMDPRPSPAARQA
jgi:ferredoxin